MISNLDASSDLFLDNLARAQQRVDRAQRQVSSGRKIESASDAPDRIGGLLELYAARNRNTQIQTNLSSAKAETDAAESVLSSAIKLMDNALSLASQGVTSSATPESQQILSSQVKSIQDQIVSCAGTMVSGRYIFSADQDQQVSYQTNPTSDPTDPNDTGVNRLIVTTATRRIEDPAGGSFQAAHTAGEIFDARNTDDTPARENVFGALNNFYKELIAGDSSAINSAIDQIKAASSHLNTELSFYGNMQNRIQNATDSAATIDTRLKTEISQMQDADVVAAALELSQGTTQIQAALSARVKIPRQTLFDLLG